MASLLTGALNVAEDIGIPGAGAVQTVTSFVGGLFGGRPNWFADAASGKLTPCAGALPVHLYELHPQFKTVTSISAQELFEALQAAPPGTPGLLGPGGLNDQTRGTVEGLRTALLYGHKELAPYLTSLAALANAAAYTAHGTYNCDAGNWSNRPAGEHAATIIYNHRQRLKQAAQTVTPVQQAAQALQSQGLSPLQLGLAGVGLFLALRGR